MLRIILVAVVLLVASCATIDTRSPEEIVGEQRWRNPKHWLLRILTRPVLHRAVLSARPARGFLPSKSQWFRLMDTNRSSLGSM